MTAINAFFVGGPCDGKMLALPDASSCVLFPAAQPSSRWFIDEPVPSALVEFRNHRYSRSRRLGAAAISYEYEGIQ